ncbi:unnamed protein product [Closterium sp. Naga37s-1]|nr:unnamed protein product [Closterium sp. Naga37s-1]
MAADACTKPAHLDGASAPAPSTPDRLGFSGAAEAVERGNAGGGLGLSRAVEAARSAIGRAVELELLNDLRIKGVLSDCDHRLNCTVTAASTETTMGESLSFPALFVRARAVRLLHVPSMCTLRRHGAC